MTLTDIVEKHLRLNGCDGLFVPDTCACKVDDLAPYDCMTADCRPGILTDGPCEKCDATPCAFHIGDGRHDVETRHCPQCHRDFIPEPGAGSSNLCVDCWNIAISTPAKPRVQLERAEAAADAERGTR